MATRVAVVGAGLGGLSAAIRLAAAGRQVTVFDVRPCSGGKAGEIVLEQGASRWRFDTGPSLLTLVSVLEDLFQCAGRRLADSLTFESLDPITRYWFDDGTFVESSSRVDHFAGSLEEAGIASVADVRAYLDSCRRIWDLTHQVFLRRSLHEFSDLLGSPFLRRSLLHLHRIKPLRSMDSLHRRYFSDPRARQLFNRYATYNGSNPYKVPATLSIIPHVEYGLGAYAVKGGIVAIPKALEALARELGVRFRFNEGVRRILSNSRNRHVRGVVTDSGEFLFDQIVCNSDVLSTYRCLLEDPKAPMARRYKGLEPSSSAMVFFWGMKSDYPELGLHNILFSKDYPDEFSQIFEQSRCPDDPTVYINITSKVDRKDAPNPGENWFVLVNAPADRGQNWNSETNRTRDAVFKRIEKSLGRDVSGNIMVESVLDPPTIADQTGSSFGSLYGISSNSRTAAFLRHPNRSRRYPGLFFVGGSAHPGGGMPLVMLSGEIAARLALKEGK